MQVGPNYISPIDPQVDKLHTKTYKKCHEKKCLVNCNAYFSGQGQDTFFQVKYIFTLE